MKAFVYALIFSAFLILPANAGQNYVPYEITDSVRVGLCPLHVFTVGQDRKYLYVVCYGWNNFLLGHEHPSIWKIDLSKGLSAPGSAVRLINLTEGWTSWPCRFDYRVDGDTPYMLLPLSNNVVLEINLSIGVIQRRYLIDGLPIDAKYDGEYIRVCVSDMENAPGRLLRYRLSTKSKVDELPMGVNLKEAIVLGGGAIGALTIGRMGKDESNLTLMKINDDNQIIDSITIHLGINGYQLFNDKGKYLYATVTGSHKILKIDLQDPFHNLHIDTLHTGATGWDGPTDVFVIGSDVFTSNYSEKLNIFRDGSNSVTTQ